MENNMKPRSLTPRSEKGQMKEDFSYSRGQYEHQTLAPARRKARMEIAACAAIVAVLAFGYLNAPFFHWF